MKQQLVPIRFCLAIYWLALFTATHWPGLGLPQAGSLGYDKLIHFGAFVVLTILLVKAQFGGSTWKNVLFAGVIAAGYAYFDEITQKLEIVNRHFSTSDLLFNLMGVVVVVGAMLPGARVFARFVLVVLAPLIALILFGKQSGFDLPEWLPRLGPTTGHLFEVRLDRILHLLGALTLTWLLAAARPFGRSARWTGVGFAVAFVAIVGPIIELVQRRFGRGDEIGDLVAHELGVLLAVLIGTAYLLAEASTKRHRVTLNHTSAKDSAKTTDFVSHSRTVSALTLVSRLTGLVRDAVIAAAWGLGPVASAFYLGFKVPNLFRRLFGEGALTAAFIPIYTDALQRDPRHARRLASLCIATLFLLLAAITIVGELVLGVMITAGDWSQDSRLAIRLTMIMLPYMPMICMVAMLGAMLQVHRRFGPTAAAPILLNLVMIGGALFAANLGPPERAAMTVAVAVLIAGVLQLLWQIVALLRVEKLTTQFAGARPAMRRMFTLMLPMVVGLAVFQINALLDSLIAFSLSPKTGGGEQLVIFGREMDFPVRQGAVAALELAQRLYQFPLGVFGIAIATAIFPALSRAATGGGDFRAILRHGLRLTIFIGLPATAGLILVRQPLTAVLFQRGEFTAADTQRVAMILMGYAFAVWAYSMTHVLTRAFYALQDAKTPLRVSVVMVFFNLILNLTLVWHIGAAGLAWSTAISAVAQTVILLMAIGRYVPQPIDGSVWLSWVKSLAVTAAMVTCILLLPNDGGAGFQLLMMVVTGAFVYIVGAVLLRFEELQWLVRR
jgi:putative peptidoglycan lipid II flippase